MNSAFTHHHAETKAGRLARGVRLVALACALVVLGTGSALAQQHNDRRDEQDMQQYPQQFPRFRLPQDRDQRDQRDDGRGGYDDQRDDQHRPQPFQQERQERHEQHESRRSGRMTPDERRDLRRQINEAGMDLYPQRR